jgi:hypothetical protein
VKLLDSGDLGYPPAVIAGLGEGLDPGPPAQPSGSRSAGGASLSVSQP